MAFNMEVGDLLVFCGVGKSNLTRGRQYVVTSIELCEVTWENFAVFIDDTGRSYCAYEGDEDFDHASESTSEVAILLDSARNLFAMGDRGGAMDAALSALRLMKEESTK